MNSLSVLKRLMCVWLLGWGLVACETTKVSEAPVVPPGSPEVLVLREGDVVKITFPGAPDLDTTQQIRRDGKISLQMAGELQAAGVTPAELEKGILKLYAAQLVSKEVTVTVQSSAFPVFISGAVLRPGKVMVDRPMTALEAVMEAGGFNYKSANLREVSLVRNEDGKVKHFTLDLKLVLDGKESKPFYVRPSDIIFVPERAF